MFTKDRLQENKPEMWRHHFLCISKIVNKGRCAVTEHSDNRTRHDICIINPQKTSWVYVQIRVGAGNLGQAGKLGQLCIFAISKGLIFHLSINLHASCPPMSSCVYNIRTRYELLCDWLNLSIYCAWRAIWLLTSALTLLPRAFAHFLTWRRTNL